jgi:DNA-binding GntR family transcriptional regulator
MTSIDKQRGSAGQSVAEAHARLRTGILTGKIEAGESSQAALAKQLDVGRTPLREAIRLLQREGLVILEPNRRVRIASLSAPDAEQLYVMRIALEGVAIRMTVPQLGSEGVAELEGFIAQMDYFARVDDFDGFRTPHRAFHAKLVCGAGDRVTTTMAQYFDHAERYRVAFGAPTPQLEAERRDEHRRIASAVAAVDPDLAARRLIEHYRRTSSLIFAAVDPDYQPSRLRLAIEALAPGVESGPDHEKPDS